MVKSVNGHVEVSLINPSNDRAPFMEVLGHDKIVYVIGQNSQNFQIKIQTTKKNSVLGAVLTIDGQMIGKGKCFKSTGHFFGFKKGDQEYEMFQFIIPEINDKYELTPTEKRLTRERMGKIRVDIFGTKKGNMEKLRNKPARKNFNNQNINNNYQPLKRLQDKKLFQAPLTVQRGGIFKHNKNFSLQNRTSIDEVDLNNQIDVVEFRYSDFQSLLINNHINIYNKHHLKFIPANYLEKNIYLLERIIKTILYSGKKFDKNFNGLSERLISEEFKKYVRIRFEGLNIGSLREFMFKKRDVFNYSPETDKFMIKDEDFKAINETIKDLLPGNLIDEKYYEKPKEDLNFNIREPTLEFYDYNFKPKNDNFNNCIVID